MKYSGHTSFARFDTIADCDGRTDRQTDRQRSIVTIAALAQLATILYKNGSLFTAYGVIFIFVFLLVAG